MTETPPTLLSLAEDRVRKFLRSAIVIDDKISWGEPTPTVTVPNKIVDPRVRFGGVEAKAEPEATPAAAPTPQEGNEPVDLKALANAFLERSIVCGVHEPVDSDSDDDAIAKAMNAAKSADVVIIDWFLKKNNAELTKTFISKLLLADRERKGYTRLIVVYTGSSGLVAKATELEHALKDVGLEATRGSENDERVIACGSCRIRLIGKRGNAEDGRPESTVPKLVYEEFAKLVCGIAPMLALATVTEMRDAAHHLLSVFRSDFDPAIISHQAILGSAEDAASFMLDVLLMQVRARLELSDDLLSPLSEAALDAWVRAKLDPVYADPAIANPPLLRDDLVSCLKGTIPEGNFNRSKKRLARDLDETLFKPVEDRRFDIAHDFARLTSLSRAKEGFASLPEGFVPILRLGSIVSYTNSDNNEVFLLCTQPLCDCVGLHTETPFSFVTLDLINNPDNAKTNAHHFVFRVSAQNYSATAASKADKRCFFRFEPDKLTRRVSAGAAPQEDGQRTFTFTTMDGVTLRWIGEVERLKAQKAAAELSGQLGRVGLDEFEWLRQGTSIKEIVAPSSSHAAG